MELRVLQYFLAVAREQNIAAAAQSLHLTQPTLSRQLKELEEELGKQLMIRGNRKITLTEDGMLLRKRAEEILDLVAIAQSSPGAIAVNGAIVVGYKLSGILGALVAILGTILPPFVILSVISVCYNVFRENFFVAQMLSGMQAGGGAVIASVTYDMAAPIIKERDPVSLCILCGAFLAACVLEIDVVYIVIACGLLGVIRTLLAKRREGK